MNPMNNDMNFASNSVSRAAQWRTQADKNNPAGTLFASEFAEADIIGGTDMLVTDCAMCTGSIKNTIHIYCA